MTRGRRKDMTIPPSRALLQQRDYRARKARYVADLEERVRHTEEENAHLREEVEMLSAQLRAAGHSAQRTSPSPEMVRQPPVQCASVRLISALAPQAAATTELMQTLAAASSSIVRFQHVALNHQTELPHPNTLQLPPIQTHTPGLLATPSFTPSPLPPPHRRLPSPHSRIELPPLHSLHGNLLRSESLAFPPPARHGKLVETHTRPYSDSECCGGYVDCNGLVDEEDEDQITEDTENDTRASTSQRMSDVRSTTASSPGAEDGGSAMRHSTRIPK
ncbi:hypothetical protein WOLCODRAFT_74855 [Wolfiporia cocos MD-104 SS10]|uniref:Uncharacterized protein n=1 Tax=Wolfiporia cocos (strain MD-104) TaxID=742152 RepID=A0A2H3JN71_WOLCO|nr:hypothetical protein WOLCODRAFT_74855 [Wolfiporia cocos MD-104 SS10]